MSEDVARAGRNMVSAADSMRQTQGFADDTVSRFMRALDEFAYRMESVAERIETAMKSRPDGA